MTWLFKILDQMSPVIADGFKEGLQGLLQKLYEQALKTDNSWDDLGIKVAAKVFGVELTEPTE